MLASPGDGGEPRRSIAGAHGAGFVSPALRPMSVAAELSTLLRVLVS